MVLPHGSLKTIRFSPVRLMGHFSIKTAPFETKYSASLSGSTLFNAMCNCRWWLNPLVRGRTSGIFPSSSMTLSLPSVMNATPFSSSSAENLILNPSVSRYQFAISMGFSTAIPICSIAYFFISLLLHGGTIDRTGVLSSRSLPLGWTTLT